jgi:hypothetical protein
MSYSSEDIGSESPKEGDHDLQEFYLMEKQKALLNAQVWPHIYETISWVMDWTCSSLE